MPHQQHFYVDFRLAFSCSIKNVIGILIESASNLKIALVIIIFTVLILPVQGHEYLFFI